MTGAPAWQGATAGQPPLAAQANQFLGPHAATMVYAGTQQAAQSTAGSGAVNGNGLWISQSFTTGAGQTAVGRVMLTLAVTGSPAPLTVGLFANSAGAPTGSALVSAAVPREFLAGTATSLSIPLPATVTASTTYWIVTTAVGDAGDYFSWSKSNQASGASTSANGSAWTAQTYGLLFQVFDQGTTGSLTHTFEDSGARWTGLEYTSGRVTGLQEYTAAQASGYVKANSALAYSGTFLTGVTQSAGVPAWSAARSGLLGDPGAVDASAQINQFLGAHSITTLYQGAQILTPNGAALGSNVPASFWSCHLDGTDYDQPFTMSGTATGRVVVPVLPVGAGADLIVSLCPNASGSPGTPIISAQIPATWIKQLAAVAGASGPSNTLQLSTPTSVPLALPQFNALLFGEGFSYDWTPPAPTSAGAITYPPAIGSGNYMVMAGGSIGSSGATNVYTVPWQGGTTLGPAVSQPPLPEPLALTALMANSTTLIAAGGATTPTGGYVASVYTAGWNPATGQISAWSQQAALPQAVAGAFGVATNSAVYVVGGQISTPALVNTVYWATISNGQISSWQSGPPLPVAIKGAFVAIIGNYLVVAGGDTNVGITTLSNAVYYSSFNADGSLSGWQVGPPMPYAVGNGNSGFMVWNSAGLATIGGINGAGSFSTEIQNLSFGPDGPGTWTLSTLASPDGNAVFPIGPGQWQVFSLYNTSYATASQYQVPQISVPLPATGLTNGATYHIVMRQAGGDLSDYLRMPLQYQPFPGNPTVQTRASSGGSGWTPGTAGNAVPIAIYDQTVAGPLLHTWEDASARHTMFVNNTTPDSTPLGYLEATAQPAPVLNVNPTFTTGTAPWVATGGTITQSSAQTHGNLPFSGKLTPSGSATTAYVESEKIPVFQGHGHVVSAWLYSPTGYATCVVNINWYSTTGTLLSTTTGTTTALAAATWTALATTGAVPAGAATATIVTAETGTPPATATLYIYAAIQDTSGPMMPAVTQIDYAGAGLGQPAVGLTQLA